MAKHLPKKTIFCLIFTFVYGASSVTAVINAATNREVTLKVEIEGEIVEVLWKHNGNKMVEWDISTAEPVEFLAFKGRTMLDKTTGDVTIKNLTKADSGLFEAEVLTGDIKSRRYTVEVYDPVVEAEITCNSSASMPTLYCVAKGDSLSYSWSGPGFEKKGQIGPEIKKEKDQDSVYTCIVNNPVSSKTVFYHATNCFAADKSYTGLRSTPPDEPFGGHGSHSSTVPGSQNTNKSASTGQSPVTLLKIVYNNLTRLAGRSQLDNRDLTDKKGAP